MEIERVEEVDGVVYAYEPNAITGFIIDGVDVDKGKGFEGMGVDDLEQWNRLALANAEVYNESDPFERKPQHVRLRTRAKLAVRNWSRNRKLEKLSRRRRAAL